MNEDQFRDDIKEFLNNDSFKKWALGIASEEFNYWESYFVNYPGSQQAMLQAKRFVTDLKNVHQEADDRGLEERIWETIQKRRSPNISFVRQYAFKAAASVGILLLSWTVINTYQKYQSKNTVGVLVSAKKEIKNSSDEIKNIVLEDGTRIELFPESTISYSESYSITDREVYLEGEAFFEVVKDPENPFYVISNDLVTKVLGTSFTVSARKEKKEATVSVKTGKVEVASKEDFDFSKKRNTSFAKSIFLNPNQKAVYAKAEERLSKTLVENPVPVNLGNKSVILNFDNTSADEVFDRVGKAFDIEIMYNKDIFKKCSLTVSLEDEALFEKLDVICKTLNASYYISGTQIVIEGNGCKF